LIVERTVLEWPSTGIVILKGNEGRLAYINEFVEQAKASGLVQ
jgi:hypothetical protein